MKIRNIFIGTFYGYRLNIEVPPELKDFPDEWFIKQWEANRISERRNAVEEYKSEQFLKQLTNKSWFGWFKR